MLLLHNITMPYIDLTRTFSAETPVYPGDPSPEIKQLAGITDSGFTMYQVMSGMHVGTHMDAPLHFVENGKTIDQIAIDRCVGNGVLCDVRGESVIDVDCLKNQSLTPGDIVLFFSGWSSRWGSEHYFTDYPVITANCAELLVAKGVSMICVDMPSIDRAPFETHKVLLHNSVCIVENCDSFEELLHYSRFEIIALPVKYETEAAPARVVARVV